MTGASRLVGYARERFGRRWRGEAGGAAALEFALVLPVIVAIYLGGFELSKALSVYRKVIDMTAQLSSLVSVSPSSVTQGQITTDISAASLIMSPYPTTGMIITVTEMQTAGPTSTPACTAAPCKATVLWSVSSTGAADKIAGTTWTQLPSDLATPNTGYTLVQTYYPYQTTIGAHYLPASIPMSNQLYMSPRQELVISCSSANC
jgi:Flp pilus assembly protein TadG